MVGEDRRKFRSLKKILTERCRLPLIKGKIPSPQLTYEDNWGEGESSEQWGFLEDAEIMTRAFGIFYQKPRGRDSDMRLVLREKEVSISEGGWLFIAFSGTDDLPMFLHE
jgi:hypothetical protein